MATELAFILMNLFVTAIIKENIIQFTEPPSSYASLFLIPSGPLSYFPSLSYNGLVGGPLPSGKSKKEPP